MKLPSLTNRAIRQYVESLAPDMPVGQRKDGQRCLVAQYLRAKLEPEYGTELHIAVSIQAICITAFRGGTALTVRDYAGRRPPLALQRVIEGFDELRPAWPLPKDVLPLLEERNAT